MGTKSMKMEEAAKEGDIFVTVTGGLHAIGKSHINNMKDGAIIANSGHFNVEIDLDSLEEMSETKVLLDIRRRICFRKWKNYLCTW